MAIISLELNLVHIIDEVGEAHKGRGALICRKVGADSAGITTGTGVKEDAEIRLVGFNRILGQLVFFTPISFAKMIIINLLRIATDLSQELLHVDC